MKIEKGAKMKIVYVTSNKYKIALAKRILEPYGIEIEQKKIYCPELQDDSVENVSRFSAKYAANELGYPVIKNDSGLIIDSLKGFPGPYAAYCEYTITESGILKLMEGMENRDADFVEVISYCEPGKEPVSFTSHNKGKISTELRGNLGYSYDKIFIPEGRSETFAELTDDERLGCFSDEAYIGLKDYLIENGKG